MSEHYRVQVRLIHVKTETEQPELMSCDLPGFRNEQHAEHFYDLLVKVASLFRSSF
jgi:hypothetical protein